MAASKTSKSQTAYYARYKASRVWESNRKARLERALKAQPENEQIKRALKNIVYRRKTPNTRTWSASWIRTAKIIKEFTGRFDPSIMSSNPEVAKTALQKVPENRDKFVPPVSDFKSFFSLAARLQGTR